MLTLQLIADRCEPPAAAEHGALVGCVAGRRTLAHLTGGTELTAQRHIRRLVAAGFVVPLSFGGRSLANVYGIPGYPGQLDPHRAGAMERRGTGPGGRWERTDTERLRGLLRQEAGANGSDDARRRAADARIAGRILASLRRRPQYRDLNEAQLQATAWPEVQRCRPDWTRQRWDAAVAEHRRQK